MVTVPLAFGGGSETLQVVAVALSTITVQAALVPSPPPAPCISAFAWIR